MLSPPPPRPLGGWQPQCHLRHRFTKRDDGGETARAAKPVFCDHAARAPAGAGGGAGAGRRAQVQARLRACKELNRRSGVLCTLLARGFHYIAAISRNPQQPASRRQTPFKGAGGQNRNVYATQS